MTVPRASLLTLCCVWLVGVVLPAQSDDRQFSASRDHPAIQYSKRPASDPVALLNRRIAAGQTTLEFERPFGYLRSVLAALEIPIESQVLVFSKTSLQSQLIGPASPRAIFFNDTVAVGWIPRAPLVEIASQDPEQGVLFYGLSSQAHGDPPLQRMDRTCLGCHVSASTLGVPGIAVGSIAPGPDGLPSSAPAYTTDHRTPMTKRWGGWFVTGTHGQTRHRGNAFLAEAADEVVVGPDSLNVESLDRWFDVAKYPARHSDIAALMVLEHQGHMTNLLTRLGWEARIALYDNPQAAPTALDSIVREVVDYMLFVDEATLAAPVRSSSGFVESFAARGRRDSRGRSLKTLDLRTRLLRYPCSYMIYTPAFDRLPSLAKQAVYQRMWAILTGEDAANRYRRLSAEDRRAVIEILSETKSDLPSYFKPGR